MPSTARSYGRTSARLQSMTPPSSNWCCLLKGCFVLPDAMPMLLQNSSLARVCLQPAGQGGQLFPNGAAPGGPALSDWILCLCCTPTPPCERVHVCPQVKETSSFHVVLTAKKDEAMGGQVLVVLPSVESAGPCSMRSIGYMGPYIAQYDSAQVGPAQLLSCACRTGCGTCAAQTACTACCA
jgi:hypothetical protein